MNSIGENSDLIDSFIYILHILFLQCLCLSVETREHGFKDFLEINNLPAWNRE